MGTSMRSTCPIISMKDSPYWMLGKAQFSLPEWDLNSPTRFLSLATNRSNSDKDVFTLGKVKPFQDTSWEPPPRFLVNSKASHNIWTRGRPMTPSLTFNHIGNCTVLHALFTTGIFNNPSKSHEMRISSCTGAALELQAQISMSCISGCWEHRDPKSHCT